MKFISVGTDENLFVKDGRTFTRIKEYSSLVDEFYCLVFTKDKNAKAIQEGNFKVIPVFGKNKLQQVRRLFQIFDNTPRLSRGTKAILSSQDAFEIGFICQILARKYDLKFLVQMHTDISTPFFKNESWRNYFQYYLAKYVLAEADIIRVVSKKMARYVNSILPPGEAGGRKVFLLPIYTDVRKFKFKKKAKRGLGGDLQILMISRIEEVKNIPLGIRAVQAFRKISRQDVKLRIVGSGGLKQKYLQKYKDRDWVQWADWTDNVEEEYHNADLLLITSNYEGWGLTAVESVASGTPVAISPVGVANEFIIDGVNGYVARGHDILNITEAIFKTLTHDFDPELMKNSLKTLDTKKEYLKKFKDMIYS